MSFRTTKTLEEVWLTYTVEPVQTWNYLFSLKVVLENVNTKMYENKTKSYIKTPKRNTSLEFCPRIQSTVMTVIAF